MKKIIVICLIIITLSTGCIRKYNLNNHEAVSYTSLRLAIAQSALNGSGSIDKTHLDALKEIVKNYNNKSVWFDDYYGNFYGVTKDTSESQIDYLCNEYYCAKLTIKNSGSNYYLIDYSFEINNIKAYPLHVK